MSPFRASAVTLTLLGMLPWGPALADSFDEGLRRAAQEREAWRTQVESGGIEGIRAHVAPDAEKNWSSGIFYGRVGDAAVVIRAPLPVGGVDVSEAVRSHNLVHSLAHQMGAPEIAQPAIEIPTPPALRRHTRAKTVMVVRHAGERRRPGHVVSETAQQAIPEAHRLVGAAIDVVTGRQDSRRKNILLEETDEWSPSAPMLLIDHDNALGRFCWWGEPNRSRFFKGEVLAYRSEQRSFDQLPSAIRETVQGLVLLDGPTLARLYGLTGREAGYAHQAAGWLRFAGLDRAASAYPARAHNPWWMMRQARNFVIEQPVKRVGRKLLKAASRLRRRKR